MFWEIHVAMILRFSLKISLETSSVIFFETASTIFLKNYLANITQIPRENPSEMFSFAIHFGNFSGFFQNSLIFVMEIPSGISLEASSANC